jgi:hypothetical protein
MPAPPPLPWLGADGRLQAYAGPDGWTHSPPGDEARLARWLAELAEYRRAGAVSRPGSVAQPPLADDASLRRRLTIAAACAGRSRRLAPAAAPPPVLDRAQAAPSSSAQEIDVADAAGLLHVSEERVRQLIRAGALGGRKAARNTWVLSRPDVIDLAERRRSGRGTGSGTGRAEATADAGREAG